MSNRTSDICRSLQSASALDQYVRDGLPEELEAHTRTCSACRTAWEEATALRTKLSAYQKQTRDRAAAIDLSAAIMREVGTDNVSTKQEARRVGRWLVPAAALVVTGALLFVSTRSGSSGTFRLEAPAGALLLSTSGTEPVRGNNIPLDVPLRIKTQGEQRAILSRPDHAGYRLALWPSSELAVNDGGRLTLVAGGAQLATPPTSAGPYQLSIGDAKLAYQGQVTVELASKERNSMKLLKKHKVAAAGAVLAVVVYGGMAHYTSATSDATISAPGGMYLDAQGRAHRFPLGSDTVDDDSFVAARESDGSDLAGAVADPSATRGAFWNPETKVVEFRLEGEALDAATGQAVADFALTAAPIDSKDFAQYKPRSWNISDAPDGHFEVAGLGLGTWKITGRAPGFAPVSQLVNLSELDADPYLVIPFSVGAQLSGRVVDWRQKPVANARVGLVDCLSSQAAKSCEIVETGADGRFSLAAVPEEEVFAVAAEHETYGVASERALRQIVGGSQHIVIQLSGRVRVFGEVSRGTKRQPVAAATVVSSEVRAQTDINGVYELFAPLTERPEAYIESEPNGPRSRAQVISYPKGRSARGIRWVDADTHVAELRIDFQIEMENGTLFGQVLDSDGAPLAGTTLRLANTSGWANGGREHETFPTLATTDAGGRYRIEHIPVQAGYRFEYQPSASEPWQTLGYVNVPDDVEVEANFQIGAASVRGRFVDEDSGEPLLVSERGCSRLGATPTGRGSEFFYLPHCYPDGRFEFALLPAGSYVLKNRLPWMNSPLEIKSREVELKAGQVLTDVRVEAKGDSSDRWRFRVLDPKGRFLSGSFLRYRDGNTSFTTNLEVDAEGSAVASINRRYDTVFIDCAGYQSREVNLRGRDPSQVIEVRLDRLAPDADEGELP